MRHGPQQGVLGEVSEVPYVAILALHQPRRRSAVTDREEGRLRAWQIRMMEMTLGHDRRMGEITAFVYD